MQKIIAFTGYKQSGKDTSIEPLLANGYELVKFAGGLKIMIEAILKYYNYSDELIHRYIEGDLKESTCPVFKGSVPIPALKEAVRALLEYQEIPKSTVDAMMDGNLHNTPTRFLGNCSPSFTVTSLERLWWNKYIKTSMIEQVLTRFRGKKMREVLITIGTEWGRYIISKNLWIDTWKNRAHKFEKVVTTDCRFQNEEEAVRSLGGNIVRVNGGKSIANNEWSSHPSESYIDKMVVDHTINNVGTIEDLHNTVMNMFIKKSDHNKVIQNMRK